MGEEIQSELFVLKCNLNYGRGGIIWDVCMFGEELHSELVLVRSAIGYD